MFITLNDDLQTFAEYEKARQNAKFIFSTKNWFLVINILTYIILKFVLHKIIMKNILIA